MTRTWIDHWIVGSLIDYLEVDIFSEGELSIERMLEIEQLRIIGSLFVISE